MPECDYCSATFDDEDAELDHLAAEHEGELGRIDRRRVDDHTSSGEPTIPPTAIYAIGGLALLALVGATLYYLVGVFSAEGQVHEHGSIELTIDDNSTNFDQPRYNDPPGNQGFHFHRGDGEHWHMHPPEPGRLTLAEGMANLGIELDATYLAIGDRSYDATQPGVEVNVTVNGESVDPTSYELHGVGSQPYDRGDDVRIVVETEN